MPRPKSRNPMSARVPVPVSKELHKKILTKSKITGVSAAHIARQAWETWVQDPVPPKPPS